MDSDAVALSNCRAAPGCGRHSVPPIRFSYAKECIPAWVDETLNSILNKTFPQRVYN